MKRRLGLGLAICLGIAMSATDARAQMTMAPFQGYFTGHIGALTGADITDERIVFGASVAVHETNGWGAEFDFGRATDVTAGRQQLDLTTYLVNAAWVRPAGTVRPFAFGGAGIMQVDGCASPCGVEPRSYDLGISVGGGIFIAVADYAGVRADVRYFFSPADHPERGRPDNLGFWRVSVGATLTWSIVP